MVGIRKIAAILVSDVVGYSRLTGADEDRILARLRTLRSDLIDPTIAVHNGRVVKRTGDGSIVEFRSVVDAVRCAIEVQDAMVERNAGVPADRRIEFRIGVHLGDVVEGAGFGEAGWRRNLSVAPMPASLRRRSLQRTLGTGRVRRGARQAPGKYVRLFYRAACASRSRKGGTMNSMNARSLSGRRFLVS